MNANTALLIGVAILALWLWDKKRHDAGPTAELDPLEQRMIYDGMTDAIASQDHLLEEQSGVCG